MATTSGKKPEAAKKAAAKRQKPATAAAKAAATRSSAAKSSAATPRTAASAAVDMPMAAATRPFITVRTRVDASRPAGVAEPWDGDPAKIPDYKADTDIVSAVLSQFRLIRGVWGKIRAVGVIVLRLLP